MEKRVEISQFQKVTEEDFDNFGLFPQESLDHVVRDIGIPDRAFTGFTPVQSGPAEITVGAGRLYSDGKVFFNDTAGGFVVDLVNLLPPVTRRIIAITVWGVDVDAEVEPRTFLQDASTRATIARATPTERWRWANIGPVSGTPGPDPTKPAIASDVLVVAWVTVDNGGIISVELAEENRAPNVRGLNSRLNENDAWRLNAGTKIDTLGSDLHALAARMGGYASADFAYRIAQDVARLKERAALPAAYTSYGADHFLTADYGTDLLHADTLCKVEEGVRFADAQIADMQIGLLNPNDEKVITTGNFMLPAYEKVARVSNIFNDGEISISQFQYQTTQTVQKMRSRQRVRWGESFTTCTNSAWWQSGQYDPISGIFTRGDETWQLTDVSGEGPALYNTFHAQSSGILGHVFMRLTRFFTDTYQEPYWENITVTEGINGSVISQTFLNTQPGYLVDWGLYFSRVASTGDVTILICETTNGAPDASRIIGRATVAAADLKVWPQRTGFLLSPTLLGVGRYGVICISAGNHFLCESTGNKFVNGSRFSSTDGAWFMGDQTRDLAFDAMFAKFTASRVEVQLNPLQLAGGIVAVDINVDVAIPAGTQLIYEVQKNGVWIAMSPTSSMGNLPPLLPFRVVFVGTADLMPGIGVGSNSRVRTSRPRADFRHISSTRTTPANVNNVKVEVRLEYWKGGPSHTFLCRLRTGGGAFNTIVTAASMTEEPAADDPLNAIVRKYTFTIPATNAYKIDMSGTTDNVTTPYHVAERVDVAATV